MYSKILVPLDGSGRAEAILPHVRELASHTGGKVILVRVVEPVPAMVGPHDSGAQLVIEDMKAREQEAENYLKGVRGTLRDQGLECEAIVMHGPVVEAVVKAATSEGVDLIALASHGRTGLGTVFYGSVAAGLLNRVERPLLLIRSREH